MSDWKSRAIPVSPAEVSDWRSRAQAVHQDAPVHVEEPGMLEAAARGLEQGVTFGFGDELNALLESAKESALDNPQSPFWDRYRQHRDESRAAFHAAEEAYPVTSFAGNVAGALAPALLTGGGAVAAKAAAGGLKAAATEGALLGAGYGALSGLGESQADLTKGDIGGAAKDVAVGGAVGSALGAGMGAGIHQFGDTLVGAGVRAKDFLKGTGKYISQLEPVHEMTTAIGQGLKGRSLVGREAEKSLKRESGEIITDVEKLLSNEGFKSATTQQELLQKAGDMPMKDWYDSAMSALDKVADKYDNSSEIAKQLDLVRSEINDLTRGRVRDLKVPVTEQITPPDADQLDKLLSKVTDLNVQNEIKRTIAKEAEDRGVRMFEAGKVHVDTPNVTDTVEYLTKEGKLHQAQRIPVEPETGKPMPQMAIKADVLEAAQRNINEKFAAAGKPFEAKIFDTSEGPKVQIIDKSGLIPKPVGKPISLKELTDPIQTITKESVQTVPVQFPTAQGPDMTMSGEQAYRLKQALGELGSAAEGSPITRAPVKAAVNRILTSPAEGRGLSIYEKALELPEDFKPLKQYLESKILGLSDVNKRLEMLQKAREVMPSVGEMLNAESSNTSATAARLKVDEFLSQLPDEIRDSVAKQFKDISEARIVRNYISGKGLGHGAYELIGGTAKGAVYGAGNIAGYATSRLYNATPELFRQTAERMVKVGGEKAAELGRILGEAASKDHVGRNAIMFAIQQNPEYRKLLDEAAEPPAGGSP